MKIVGRVPNDCDEDVSQLEWISKSNISRGLSVGVLANKNQPRRPQPVVYSSAIFVNIIVFV